MKSVKCQKKSRRFSKMKGNEIQPKYDLIKAIIISFTKNVRGQTGVGQKFYIDFINTIKPN